MNRHGFTLIESLIYIVLFAMSTMVLTSIFMSSLRTNQITKQQHALLQAHQLAEIRMRETVEQANAIISPASDSSEILTVDGPTFFDGPVSFFVTDGILFLQEGALPEVALTSSSVEVSAFEITRLTSSPAGIMISFTTEKQTADLVLTQNSQFTVLLRYE